MTIDSRTQNPPSKKRSLSERMHLQRQGVVLTELQQKRIADCPKKSRNLYHAALLGAATRSQAIRAKCQECVGFEDTIDRVSKCTVKTCPLWKYRPYQKKA